MQARRGLYQATTRRYAPAPKKATKATAKKAAPKARAPAKPKATAAKKKVLVEKDDNADSDINMDDDDDIAGPTGPAASAPTKKKTASETYTKVSVGLYACIRGVLNIC